MPWASSVVRSAPRSSGAPGGRRGSGPRKTFASNKRSGKDRSELIIPNRPEPGERAWAIKLVQAGEERNTDAPTGRGVDPLRLGDRGFRERPGIERVTVSTLDEQMSR